MRSRALSPAAIAKKVVFYISLVIIATFFMFPVVWVLTTSLKLRKDMYTESPVLIFKPTFENYSRVFHQQDFARFFLNSTIIAIATTILVAYLGALGAYALTRYRFRGHGTLALSIIAARMFPPIALLPSFFLLASQLHLVNTRPIVIFAHTAYGLPFIVFMLLGFCQQVPVELDEAALIDGCSRFGLFNRVILPNIAPGLAAAAILAFVYSWNEFLFALVLTRAQTKTLPVVISEFLGFVQVDWQGLTAMATILIIPSIIITIFGQKYLVRGLTAGAVKG